MKQAFFGKVAFGAVVLALAAAGAVVEALAAPTGWLAIDGAIRNGGGSTVDWANSGVAGPATCAPGAVDVTGSGGLFNCGRSSGSNTVPPTAPVLVRNDATIVSSRFIVDPESGDTTACGSGDPTTTGGKNGDAIASYNVTVGSVNNKTDLSNVYAVVHTRPDGHPEIYFGAERLVNNGESHVDFEFLQSAFSLAPCATGVGALNGHRTQGDLLVAVDFTNGGSLAGFSVREWHCAADPGPPAQPPDGTVCDPSGGPEHYELITTTTEVDLAVNAAGPVSCGGWICRDAAGAPIANVDQNDLMEGGIDLPALGFTGCFNTFLPHTRVSAPFTADLSDFAGPVALPTCRNPVSNSSPGGSVASGASVRDVVTLANGGVAVKPTGTVTYFLCTPAQVTGSGCGGGTQVGAAKTLVAGAATSDPTSSTQALGKYCWRTVYAPDNASLGIYSTASHTNATTECFSVVAASLPNTGMPGIPVSPWLPLQALLAAPALLFALAWSRARAVAGVLVAGVIIGSSPAHPTAAAVQPAPSPGSVSLAQADPTTAPAAAPIMKPKPNGWRLVIPRISVDAQIHPVGRDTTGAMAAPGSLVDVGWFNHGPAPGESGDAVLDGHYGDWMSSGVFRQLHNLRRGDVISVVWPDGRSIDFKVTRLDTVPASSHPAGLFARTGSSRISLITCAGSWDPQLRSYKDRLIVTAVPV